MTVMVIEDHKDSLELIRLMLETSNFAVQQCRDREQAVKVLSIAVPDIIIMHMTMAGMPLPRFVAHIRALAGSIRIILMSGDETGHDVARVNTLVWLPKPFNLAQLVSAIEGK